MERNRRTEAYILRLVIKTTILHIYEMLDLEDSLGKRALNSRFVILVHSGPQFSRDWEADKRCPEDAAVIKLQETIIYTTMRFLQLLLPYVLLAGAGVAQAASSWGIEDASISVSSNGGAGFKDKYAL